MQYFSTNHKSPKRNFKDATISGQAPDKGLYFPEYIPKLSADFIKNIEVLTNEEIAFEVIKPFVDDCIPENVLKSIVEETINFKIPLIGITENIFSLELYHGPTLAFKDVGARFMSRCLSYFVKNDERKLTVLVATSGDTGGAVANGFFNVPNINVVILYPSGKVSSVQEKQLTTLGKNITALEVNGSFDDCQQMVKKAFADESLTDKVFLTSANSINVARWLPQMFYYFFAYKQWKDKSEAPIISVPSGNFGNICAGILASEMGLPVKHFIAACNANDVVPQFLNTNEYLAKKAVPTISNAMDVGDPSNFVRILEIFHQNIDSLKSKISSTSVSDNITKEILKQTWIEHNYLLDPHGAVGYKALSDYINLNSGKGIVLETAHPVKFYDVVEPIIESKVEIPETVKAQINLEKKSLITEPNYDALKSYILSAS